MQRQRAHDGNGGHEQRHKKRRVVGLARGARREVIGAYFGSGLCGLRVPALVVAPERQEVAFLQLSGLDGGVVEVLHGCALALKLRTGLLSWR